LELALLFVKIPKEEKKESIYEVLDRLKLSHAMRQYPDQLSGGMRRRAVLAAAILRRPKILLCDEPFTGQDPVTKDDLVQLFSLIREEYGFSMILVSHDVRETLQLCDETILLMDGKLQAKGDKEALMSGASDRARRFMELGSYV
jgi:ABC-type transporter Mla maintaining outer membrane lipid asymmetry ATPase subunit MlaF